MDSLTKRMGAVRTVVSSVIWRELQPGEERPQIHTTRILVTVSVLAAIFTVAALFMPQPAKYVGEFRESMPTEVQKSHDDEREQALARATSTAEKAFTSGGGLQNSNVAAGSGGRALSGSVGGGGSSSQDQNSAMIIARPGGSQATQVNAGLKFTVKLLEHVTVNDQPVPVIAEVTHGVFNDAGVGIAEGARLFGTAQFQNDADVAQIQFTSLADPAGVVRPIKAVALGDGGQMGVAGQVHSKSLKNTAGQFVSRFAGAFAEGSQQRDFLGNSRGGVQNGLLNAVGETAKDRTNWYAEDLKKEHQWIEIPRAQEFNVILFEPYSANDPGEARLGGAH